MAETKVKPEAQDHVSTWWWDKLPYMPSASTSATKHVVRIVFLVFVYYSWFVWYMGQPTPHLSSLFSWLAFRTRVGHTKHRWYAYMASVRLWQPSFMRRHVPNIPWPSGCKHWYRPVGSLHPFPSWPSDKEDGRLFMFCHVFFNGSQLWNWMSGENIMRKSNEVNFIPSSCYRILPVKLLKEKTHTKKKHTFLLSVTRTMDWRWWCLEPGPQNTFVDRLF